MYPKRSNIALTWGDHLGSYDDAAAFARQAPVAVSILEQARR